MNVPQLRFKGFEGEWKKVRFEEVFFEKNKRTGDSGDYPLFSLTVEKGITPKTERYERSFLVKKEDNYKVVEPNDFVYNPMNLTLGAIAKHNDNRSISVSGYYNVFSSHSDFNKDFLEIFLKSSKMILHYKSIATGSLIEKQRVHFSQFLKIKRQLPTLEEQKKIGSFFALLSSRIRLQQEKIEKLEQFKKGKMQKIFSQELRFKDEDGGEFPEWEVVKMKEVTKKVGPRNKEDEKLPIYSINNKKGFLLQNEQFESSRLEDLEKVSYKIVKPNQFAYNPSRINVGSIGHLKTDFPVLISSLYVCFEVKNDVYPLFMEQYVSTYTFNKEVSKNTEGSVREYLFYENFSNIKFLKPSLEEQRKVANYFNHLDLKLKKEQEKLMILEEQKRGLMEMLFI